MPETRTSHDAAHARLFTFGSKAETLQTLKGRLTQATVPDSYFFSIQGGKLPGRGSCSVSATNSKARSWPCVAAR